MSEEMPKHIRTLVRQIYAGEDGNDIIDDASGSCSVVADWLEEQERRDDADKLRRRETRFHTLRSLL